MAESHLVSGLKSLRAEKMGALERVQEEILKLEAEAERIEALIGNIDGVLKDQAPDLDLSAVKPTRARPKSDAGQRGAARRAAPARTRARGTRSGGEADDKHGPVTKHILKVMRAESFPMTAEQIATIVGQQRGATNLKKLRFSVNNFIYTRLREGLLVKHDLRDGTVAYTINRSQTLDEASREVAPGPMN